MEQDVETIEEQLNIIGQRLGQPLDVHIYLGDTQVAARGHLITAELVSRLAQMDHRRLRFSREDAEYPGDGAAAESVLNSELIPHGIEIALEAGVSESIADEARQRATRKVKEIFESCRYLTKLDLASISELAVNLINRVSSLDAAAFKLHDLKNYDEYTYFHSVNVCILGVTLFKEHISNEQELIDLGIGLLLHDIGKSKIDLKIINKPGRLTDDEFAVMRRHVVYGYNLVKNNGEMATLSKEIILNHHERANGMGYMRGLTDAQMSFFDQIAAVCDVFDAVTTDRIYRTKMDVHRAVSILIRGSGSQFNTRVVNSFLKGIGRFPVGTFVLLNNGEIGVVSRINSNALSLPVLRIIFDDQGARLPQPRTVDLYEQRELYIDKPLDLSYSPAVHQLASAYPSS